MSQGKLQNKELICKRQYEEIVFFETVKPWSKFIYKSSQGYLKRVPIEADCFLGRAYLKVTIQIYMCHPCSERGYCMTGWNSTHLLDFRVWNPDKTTLHWTLNHVTGFLWSLSYFVRTEACFLHCKMRCPQFEWKWPN